MLRREVGRALRDPDFPAAEALLAGALALLTAQPQADCMLRDLLESAHRVASLAPALIARATSQRPPTPTRLLARPLQEAGVPILARDLPPISAPGGVRSDVQLRGSSSPPSLRRPLRD